MDLMLGCLHIVSNKDELDRLRACIYASSGIGIMCYAVIKPPLRMKDHTSINSSSGFLLCVFSISHGYDPVFLIREKKIGSVVLVHDIDPSEKFLEGNNVVLKNAIYFHKYSEFIKEIHKIKNSKK